MIEYGSSTMRSNLSAMSSVLREAWLLFCYCYYIRRKRLRQAVQDKVFRCCLPIDNTMYSQIFWLSPLNSATTTEASTTSRGSS